MRRLGSVALGLLAVALTVLVGLVATKALSVVAVLLAVPAAAVLILWMTRRYDAPVCLAAAFIASQPLTAFAIPTPVATLTVDNALLVLMVALYVPGSFRSASPASRKIAAALFVWLASYLLRINYLTPLEVARELVTVGSFVAIFLVARTLPTDWRSLKVYIWSGWSALAVFGVASYLVAIGALPPPTRFNIDTIGTREIFGIVSPWPRNYGLEVAWDSIAFLAAFVAPGLAYLATSPGRTAGRQRIASTVGLAFLTFCALYLFQARGLLLDVVLGLALILFLARPALRVPILVTGAVGGGWLIQSIVEVDDLSSNFRIANFTHIWQTANEAPWLLLLGQDENEVSLDIARSLGTIRYIGLDNNAIHNAFLSALVGGGIIAFIALTLAYWRGAALALRQWREAPSHTSTYLLAALGLCIFEMMVETARAQVVGNWLVLGLVAGAATAASDTRSSPSRLARRRADAR